MKNRLVNYRIFGQEHFVICFNNNTQEVNITLSKDGVEVFSYCEKQGLQLNTIFETYPKVGKEDTPHPPFNDKKIQQLFWEIKVFIESQVYEKFLNVLEYKIYHYQKQKLSNYPLSFIGISNRKLYDLCVIKIRQLSYLDPTSTLSYRGIPIHYVDMGKKDIDVFSQEDNFNFEVSDITLNITV